MYRYSRCWHPKRHDAPCLGMAVVPFYGSHHSELKICVFFGLFMICMMLCSYLYGVPVSVCVLVSRPSQQKLICCPPYAEKKLLRKDRKLKILLNSTPYTRSFRFRCIYNIFNKLNSRIELHI
jgi:hypothetical protein